MFFVLTICSLLVGFFLGVAGVYGMSAHGEFIVNRTNPDKDIYRLQFDKLSDVEAKKYVLLRIIEDK